MKRIIVLYLLVLSAFLPEKCHSFETADTAKQFEKGQYRFLFFYSGYHKKPAFRIGSNEEIIVSDGSRNFRYSSFTEQTFTGNAYGEETCLKVITNPFGGLYWWLKAGTRGCSLEMISTEKQLFESSSGGMTGGFGVRYQVSPETIVTPGVSVDMGITVFGCKLDKLHDGAGVFVIDNRLEEAETQFSVTTSRMYSIPFTLNTTSKRELRVEPYGGAKVIGNYIRMTDNISLAGIAGSNYDFSLFAGSKIRLSEFESAFIEISVLSEQMFTLGLSWGY
jgi:hypothetical protein